MTSPSRPRKRLNFRYHFKRQFGTLRPVTSLSKRHETGNSTPSSSHFNSHTIMQMRSNFVTMLDHIHQRLLQCNYPELNVCI